MGMFILIFLEGCSRITVREMSVGTAMLQIFVLVLSFCGMMIIAID